MEKTELNQRSPLRAVEASLGGGLGAGDIGVVVARTGVGKTAFLVGIALDKLLRSQRVLHVSIGHSVEKVCAYYDEIFSDLAHDQALSDVWQVRLEMERNRNIHVYSDGNISAERLRKSLGFMQDHSDFAPSAIVFDDCNFNKMTSEGLADLRSLGKEKGCEIWMSAITTRDAKVSPAGIPEPVASLSENLDVILGMAHNGDSVHISPLKVRDKALPESLELALDPRTLLLISK
jgi:hypothetical protein